MVEDRNVSTGGPTKPPSRLRKLIPPLIWPVGLLLVLGYWFVERRQSPGRADAERMARETRAELRAGNRASGVDYAVSGPRQVQSVSVALEPRASSLAIPIIIVIGVGLWIAVLRRPKDDRESATGR
jgi:hypothetical protein